MNERKPITAAVHVHSDWSYDGHWPLERLARCFARRGCRVLLMSEHDRGFDEARWQAYRQACCEATNERILVVPGMEYSDRTNTIHILAWGDAPFLGADLPTGELLERATEMGLYTVLAHPARKNAWKHIEPAWTQHLGGVEVWNRKADGFTSCTEGWSFVHEAGLLPFVGLDFHRRRQMFPAVMRLHGLSDVDHAAVYAALRERRVTGYVMGVKVDRFEAGVLGGVVRLAELARGSASRVIRRSRRSMAVVA